MSAKTLRSSPLRACNFFKTANIQIPQTDPELEAHQSFSERRRKRHARKKPSAVAPLHLAPLHLAPLTSRAYRASGELTESSAEGDVMIPKDARFDADDDIVHPVLNDTGGEPYKSKYGKRRAGRRPRILAPEMRWINVSEEDEEDVHDDYDLKSAMLAAAGIGTS